MLGLFVFVAAAGYPLAAGVLAAILPEHSPESSLTDSDQEHQPATWRVTATTTLWAASVVPGALALGWWPGLMLARLRSRVAFVAGGTLCLTPLCLPEYLLYWSWWQSWPVDSALSRWAVETGRMDLARGATLWLGLVSWSWPIAAWIIAVSPSRAQAEEMLLLDTRSRVRRHLLRLRQSGREIALAAIIIFAFIFNNTTSFDLAQVPTLGYELRAMLSEGSTSSEVLRAAWPGMAVVGAAGAMAALLMLRRSEEHLEIPRRGARARPGEALVGSAIVIAGVAIPFVLIWGQEIDDRTLRDLVNGYGQAALNTAMAAAGAGVASAVAAVGFAGAFADRRMPVRVAAGAAAVMWLLAGLMPAAAVASALETAYNVAFPLFDGSGSNFSARFDEGIYRTAAIMILGYLARFGFIAILLGWWLARAEQREMLAMRELDGGGTLLGLYRAWRPGWLAAGAAAFGIVTVLALGEVSLTALIQPPGFDAISAILLNNMHYQRSEMVVLMARILIVLAVTAALTATTLSLLLGRKWHRPLRGISSAAMLGMVLCASGCEDNGAQSGPADPEARLVFGEPGRSLGQFVYPRAMDIDPARGFVYVIDRSGRIQRFGLDGEPQKQWLLPDFANGYPTGVTVGPDGRVFVADTHANRISIFDADGQLLEQFGVYGMGPGQFVFPSDVALGPEGRFYVSEFGDNDRIQVFDREWNYLFEFGGFGSAPGQFNRPQSMSFSRDGSELFVADSCNHRVQVFDPEGNLVRILGSIGTEPGKFRYPYGVVVLEDGRIAVTEFGNHRVQILDAKGESLHVLGRPGAGTGELMAPWASAAIGDDLYVLDSRNSRVQVMDVPP